MNHVVVEKLKTRFADAAFEFSEFRAELTVVVPKEIITEVCQYLKEAPELTYDSLSDLCGIDMNTPAKRFGVIYNLY